MILSISLFFIICENPGYTVAMKLFCLTLIKKSRKRQNINPVQPQVQFTYQSGSWINAAGVRVTFKGYKEANAGEWSVDTARWNTILDLAKKGVEITGAVMDQVAQGAAIYASGGAAGEK